MKFTFEPNLAYQRAAIDAATGLFVGQEAMTTQFTVLAHPGGQGTLDEADTLGHGNRLRLTDQAVLSNLRAVQGATGLAPEPDLTSMDFTVEMETGTGKTYVYLRTIYEFHQLYGFTKFVIVVPSIAIKEGVLSSFEMLREHLETLYGHPGARAFVYESSRLSRVRSFAVSSTIDIMVVTVHAINKADTNKIFAATEALDGERAIDLIKATRPVVIVDEPQSVYGDKGLATGKRGSGRKALEAFSALATLRYSATHPKNDKANLVYSLDAIGAYEQGLVKQIEVHSLTTEGSGTVPYVRLRDVSRSGAGFNATVELDCQGAGGVTRSVRKVKRNDNLAQVTGREQYRNLTVGNIGLDGDLGYISFLERDERLLLGQAIGDDLTSIEKARQMIRATITHHLEKELEFADRPAPIKVLSLFFVDEVAKYREYDGGTAVAGEYARIFEDEYAKVAARPRCAPLLAGHDPGDVARGAHQGYFSIDRKKGREDRLVDTDEGNDTGRQRASLAYEQIMRGRAELTTPGNPIRFVFSHSALREGWDNPNVFQICVLRTMGSEMSRRQSLGRGLRLCVDATGHRVKERSVNRLTVMADESFESFAKALQTEYEEETGVEFGRVSAIAIAKLTATVTNDEGIETVAPVGSAAADGLIDRLRKAGYIDLGRRVEDLLREALRSEDEVLNEVIAESVSAAAVPQVLTLLRRAAGSLNVVESRQRHQVQVNDAVLTDPAFVELWERIRQRTVYRVEVDSNALVAACIAAVDAMPPVVARSATWRTTRVSIDEGGISGTLTEESTAVVDYEQTELLPDILSVLADRTRLTRNSLAVILTGSHRMGDFTHNPQVFIDRVVEAITREKTRLLVDGVRYEPVPVERPERERAYEQSLFAEADLAGYLGSRGNILIDDDGQPIELSKSVYRNLVADSAVERALAQALQARTEVKVFAKLPARFTIPTPLGDYNPDWAVVVKQDDGERLFFVLESKSSLDPDKRRPEENMKIRSGERHFDVVSAMQVGGKVEYTVVKDLESFAAHWI